jgi:hypothetical protein
MGTYDSTAAQAKVKWNNDLFKNLDWGRNITIPNTLNADYQECLYRSSQSYDLIAYAINESNGGNCLSTI